MHLPMPVRSLTQSVLRWPDPEQLLDALVFTPEELERLLGSDQRMATELQSDLRWLWTRSANQLQ